MLLELHGVDAWYGAAQALFEVGLHVDHGEVLALVGRNGAGKSTTLKAVNGLVERRGTVLFEGRRIDCMATHRIARLGIGYVPEDRRIFAEMSVRENLEAGRQAARSGIAPWTFERVYTLFPSLAGMPDRRGGEMSGGEQQMLALGRTLMGNPRLVLLDEPSEGVAPLVVEAMAAAVQAMKSEGVAVLLSEQNRHFAARVADRTVNLDSGQVM